eukprot:COSAG05_NODE_12274_length_474_cov_4.482667_1_plen_61_part_10
MLGTAVTSGATPDTTPESKLAKEIKNIISAEFLTFFQKEEEGMGLKIVDGVSVDEAVELVR